ncbi:hypothetical protein GCM10009730_67020 [Streptomyces albidochromogenes]
MPSTQLARANAPPSAREGMSPRERLAPSRRPAAVPPMLPPPGPPLPRKPDMRLACLQHSVPPVTGGTVKGRQRGQAARAYSSGSGSVGVVVGVAAAGLG